MQRRILTPIMSIVLEQTALRWRLNLPVNCEIVSLSVHSHSFNLSAFWIPQTSQRWHSPSQTGPFFQKRIDSNFPFILCSDLYITYLWNPFDSYYHPVKQTEDFVKERQARQEDRRWCCSEAAILQKSFIISKAKMCKSHNKGRT